MAKITGPFMSLSASGTVGGKITIAARPSGSVASIKPHPATAPSVAQARERQRMRDARTAFKALDSPTLAKWQALAALRHIGAWAIFFQEWNFQLVDAGALPLIPAAVL